jgi:hypothetical protein
MKRVKALTSQQLRNRIARYKRFVAAMEHHLKNQTPIHDLVPALGTGEPSVYDNPHFIKWIRQNGQRNRAENRVLTCNTQLVINFWNNLPEGVTPDQVGPL